MAQRDSVEFVGPGHAAGQLRGATPGFLGRLGPANLAARGCPDVEAYLALYERSTSVRPSGRVLRAVRRAAAEAVRAAPPALRAAAPWRVAFTDGAVEGGMPHTVGDTIVLPLDQVSSDQRRLSALLLHEAAHVEQRRDPASWQSAAVAMGFRPAGGPVPARFAGMEARANPDTDGSLWTLGGASCTPYLVPGGGLRDVVRHPNDRLPGLPPGFRNHEHPMEVLAEAAELAAHR